MQHGSEFIPNGLLSSEVPFVVKVLDKNRWSKAEARTAQLLANIQPNPKSESRRNDIVSYLRSLIMKFVPCKVFTFGSVPLKTYLPDGDIDLTAFGDNLYPEDRLIQDVRYILEREQKNERAQFRVEDVQFIRAEVKIIKCLVENFAVDISFNQVGGLGTLCFLEEVNYLIKQNHIFKRSIILVKAWCYYESRILGSQHGLISTYALEILVIYVFHVYSNTFAGPLEVLFRFLDFFSKFDWSNYCISLRGPVPIKSLPNMRGEPPRKNCQQFLLSQSFLNACVSCYGVIPNRQELREKPFASKYINIVDPLRANNNLGRSIREGNFSRIKNAFAFGATQIERLLDCPEDNLIAEVDLFFRNTWERNGNGYRIDARSYNFYSRSKNVTSYQSLGQNSHDWINGYAFDPEKASSDYYYEHGSGAYDENVFPVNEAVLMHGEDHEASIFNAYSSAVSFPPPHGLAPGDLHDNSFGVFLEDMPYSRGTGPFHSEWFPSLGSGFYKAQPTETVDYNVLVPHSDHQRQKSVTIGSISGNSSKSGATSYTTKDSVITSDQKRLTREKHSGNSLDNRNKNKNVKNSRASSRSRTGSSSKTHQPHGVSGNKIGQSTIGTDLRENTSSEAITSQVQALQLDGKFPKTLPNSSVPGHTPLHVPSGSSKRAVNNRSLLPVSDGSSGSSFQVPTMFPFYNAPTDTGTAFATVNDVNMHAELGNINYPPQSSVWNSTQLVHNHSIHDAANYILEGDVESYLLNLQYGRLSKNPQLQRSLPIPPPSILPLRRQFPWYRKTTPSGVMNSMGHFHTQLAVMPSQHASNWRGRTKESDAFWLPRFSDGTGTYMPNPRSYFRRYYKGKHYQKFPKFPKFRYVEIQNSEKEPDNVEVSGSNESSHRGESSQSGISEVANFGSDSKSSSEH